MAKKSPKKKQRSQPTQQQKPVQDSKPPANHSSPLFSSSTSKSIMWAMGILTLAVFIIRVLNLGDLTLWVDEYVFVTRAQGVVNGTGPLLTYDNNGILFAIFVLPFYYLFEISAYWGRFPSVLFGAGSTFLIFLLGKRLFNNFVGITAAVISAASLYLTFWSRIARNYAIFEFFFLVVLLAFILAFWPKEKNGLEKEKKNLLEKFAIDGKGLLFFFGAFFLSLISHQLTFFSVFGAGAYFLFQAISQLIKKQKGPETTRNLILGSTFFVIASLILSKVLTPVVRSVITLFVPEKFVNWFIPDWEHLAKVWEEKPYEAFNKYFDLFSYDLGYLVWVGMAGFLIAYLIKPRSANYLLTMFWIPLLLMSFVYRDAYLPRYILFLYPLLILSTAVAIYGVYRQLERMALQKSNVMVRSGVALGLAAVMIAPTLRSEEIKSLVTVEKDSGYVVDKKLSSWFFTNWKYPINYVRNFYQPGDIVFATVPKPVDFYLGIDYTKRFRQRHLDTELRQYVMNDEPEDQEYHAWTTQGFIDAVNNYQRGWLIADYYFYNALTDPQARQFAIQNLTYHYDAGRDGVVHVFSWDHAKPRGPQKSMLVVLGKGTKVASREMNMDMPNLNQGSKVRVYLDVEAIDHNQEAILVINKQNSVYIPKGRTNGREQVYVDVSKSWFKPKNNVIQFGYNQQKVKGLSGNIDFRPGFAIYNLTAGPI